MATLQHSCSPFLSPLPRVKPTSFFQNPNPRARLSRFTILCSSSSSWEKEEARWLREEQRWLREEQRWLREEARWREERERLLAEIGMLRLKLEIMEKERLTDVEAVVARPMPVLVDKAAVKELLLEEAVKVEEEVKEVREVGAEEKKEPEKKKKKPGKRSLRVGTEGDDVRAMQEALQKLGFYCGEEDIEFSSFSSGTERAVKTWQATLGTREDGIMTEELLNLLFSEKKPSNTHEGLNGAPIASVAQVAAEIAKTVVKESSASNSEAEVSNRVFLLGENRWEDRSRLVQINNKQGIKDSGTKCLSCRGEGRLMCTECDGTGEPNIEPQFLEWVDEDTKCPYCEGLGYTICDTCEGKTFVNN